MVEAAGVEPIQGLQTLHVIDFKMGEMRQMGEMSSPPAQIQHKNLADIGCSLSPRSAGREPGGF
jgi:hypothetical protein